MLSLAIEHPRLECGRPVAHLHPTEPGRSRLPDSEERSIHSSDLAPEGESGPCAHLRVFLGVCPVEDVGAVAVKSGTWKQPPNDSWGTRTDPERRRRLALGRRARTETPLRRTTGQGPILSAGAPGTGSPRSTPTPGNHPQNVVQT